MTRKAHLFKIGHTTYALIGTKRQAYDYVKHVWHYKPEDYKYLGVDKRTPQQQFESFTIGVNIAEDWRPPK